MFKADVTRSNFYSEKSFGLQWRMEYNSQAGTPTVSLLGSSRHDVVGMEVEKRAGGEIGKIG